MYLPISALSLGLLFAFSMHSQIISTVAGTATWRQVVSVAVDSAMNQYIADYEGHVVYKVDRSGVASVVAGVAGRRGYSGDGGPAANAQLNNPSGVAIDPGGNVYIADTTNDRIRKVAPDGIITTIAGTARPGFSGDGGLASSTQISSPIGMAIDSRGNLYFADYGNARIRRIAPGGIITTIAGFGRRGYSGDGEAALLAQINPGWIALSADGSLFFSDDGPLRGAGGNRRVRKIAANGLISTLAGNGLTGYSGDGDPAISAGFQSVDGVAVDTIGNVYIAEYAGNRIRKVDARGIITTFAGTGRAGFSGDGNLAVAAQLNNPAGLALDAQGNL